ncbi:hypothetical protein ElyMa_004979800 [Elysia marginata]|uniref:Peptidase S1 domain-containing protein n=1 Tax=Elysia marginata TaxID=1093978 RepID=A0AAV4J7B5_9GAST|nr:hypothetical protein ElyMa_004979800 [Elysia marginata]
MRHEPAWEDKVHRGENPRWQSKKSYTDGLTGAVSQLSDVKPTLNMGAVTSYVIVVHRHRGRSHEQDAQSTKVHVGWGRSKNYGLFQFDLTSLRSILTGCL